LRLKTLTYEDDGNTATQVENGVTTTYSWDMDDKKRAWGQACAIA
jgi:hypothetical protein